MVSETLPRAANIAPRTLPEYHTKIPTPTAASTSTAASELSTMAVTFMGFPFFFGFSLFGGSSFRNFPFFFMFRYSPSASGVPANTACASSTSTPCTTNRYAGFPMQVERVMILSEDVTSSAGLNCARSVWA